MAVHAVVAGSGSRTLLLLHGFSDNLATWNRIVPLLARRYRVLCVDLPGFGLSPPRPGPLLDGYLAAVDEVLDEHGVGGPVSIIGNSLGAIVAALYADSRPERVERVVLIGMPAVRGVAWYWRTLLSRPVGLALTAAARPLPARTLQGGVVRLYSLIGGGRWRAFDGDVVEGFGRHYAEKERVLRLLTDVRHVMAAVRPLRLVDVVAGLPVPVQLVWGRCDLPAPARHARHYPVRPHLEIVVIPRSGHLPQLDRPAELLTAITPFLDPAR